MKLFLGQLGAELKKLFARRRTYIGYAAFLILELVVLIGFSSESGKKEMEKLLSQNGLSFDQIGRAHV